MGVILKSSKSSNKKVIATILGCLLCTQRLLFKKLVHISKNIEVDVVVHSTIKWIIVGKFQN